MKDKFVKVVVDAVVDAEDGEQLRAGWCVGRETAHWMRDVTRQIQSPLHATSTVTGRHVERDGLVYHDQPQRKEN